MANIVDLAWSALPSTPTSPTTNTTIPVTTGDGALFASTPMKALMTPPGVIPTKSNSECVLITGRSGDNLTVVRDYKNWNGGVGRSVAQNWIIMQTPFADDFFNTTLVSNEVPGGSINGSNTSFTTASIFRTNSLRVFLNGQRLTAGASNDYQEVAAGTGFTMNYAPATGDVLLVDYAVGDTTYAVGGNSIVSDETPTGSVNGSNTSFTTQRAYISTSLEVFINGLKQIRGTDYTETTPGSGIFTMAVAPATGDAVRVNYQFNLAPSSNADTVDGFHASQTPVAGVVPATDSNNMVLANIYRNFIINGACQIAQRGAASLSTSSQYGQVDRFRVHATGTAVSAGTIAQNTSAPVGRTGNSLHISSATITGTGVIYLKHRIEAKDALDFKNQIASFAVAVYQDTGVAVNYTITIRKPTTTADDFSAVTDISNSGALSVPNAASTVIKYENVSMGDCSKGIEIEIRIDCGAITTKNFHFAEFQFNRGAKALTFEPQTFADDLKQCQRYFEKSFPYSQAPANGASGTVFYDGSGHSGSYGAYSYNTSLGQIGVWVAFKVTKRVAPTTFTGYGNSSGQWVYYPGGTGASWAGNSVSSLGNLSDTGFAMAINANTTTYGIMCGHWTADAEL